ncbi:MAG: HEPN domain-containing protein [Candidatus Micrarchaeota archaeon]
MDLKELLLRRYVEKVQPDSRLAESLFAWAEKDLNAAEDNLSGGHADWALAIAYNAMLSAGRALMARKGFRATSEAHHFAVVQFCAAVLPKDSSGLVAVFNRNRVRRHDVVYGEADSVGEDEASRAIGNAKKFVRALLSLK